MQGTASIRAYKTITAQVSRRCGGGVIGCETKRCQAIIDEKCRLFSRKDLPADLQRFQGPKSQFAVFAPQFFRLVSGHLADTLFWVGLALIHDKPIRARWELPCFHDLVERGGRDLFGYPLYPRSGRQLLSRTLLNI